MEKLPIWIFVVIVLLGIAFYIGTLQGEVVRINLPDPELFQKACLYHGVEKAWISINGTEFYAVRYNKEWGRTENFMLFTNDFTRSVVKDLKKKEKSVIRVASN